MTLHESLARLRKPDVELKLIAEKRLKLDDDDIYEAYLRQTEDVKVVLEALRLRDVDGKHDGVVLWSQMPQHVTAPFLGKLDWEVVASLLDKEGNNG